VRGEGGGALGEYDAELAGGAPEEADQHGGPPRPEQLAGAGAGSGGHRVGGLVRGGSRPVEPQAADERLHLRAGSLLPVHGGGRRDQRICQAAGALVGAASAEGLPVWFGLAKTTRCGVSEFLLVTILSFKKNY
jgi:hypothetical protein